MKPIRDQLRERAEAIRVEWAKAAHVDRRFKSGSIVLETALPSIPEIATRDAMGRVNDSDVCGIPPGCLMIKSARTTIGAAAGWAWIEVVLSARETPFADFFGPEAFTPADFNSLLDALEPPCGEASEAPDEPSPGSWRNRPALL